MGARRGWVPVVMGLMLAGPTACSGASEPVSSPSDPPTPASPDVVGRSATCDATYPVLASRIANFEARRASSAPNVRLTLVRDVSRLLPIAEAERYTRDAAACEVDAAARGAAVDALVKNGHRLVPADLPLGMGEPGDQWPRSLTEARARVVGSGARAGWAAHYLSVYGEPGDAVALQRLSTDANVFARFAAAGALVAIGETAAGAAGLDAIARLAVAPGVHFYVERALFVLHSSGDPSALADLVAFLDEIDDGSDPNDAVHVDVVLDLLAALTGTWHADAAGWRAWLAGAGLEATSARR